METTDSQNENSLAQFSEQLAAAVERASKSVVAIDSRPRVATSGVIWRNDQSSGAIIVSTNHTIRRDEDITVTLPDNQKVSATLVGRDPGTDLAVLKTTDETVLQSLKPAEIGNAATVKVGNLILAVGRTRSDQSATASLGIVSAAGGAWKTWRGDEIDRLISLDLTIRLGFSGGALVDSQGLVLGINTSAFGRGMALTIPASTVNRVVDALLTKGHIARPFLGVGMQAVPLPETLRSKHNLEQNSGLIMLTVEPDGPADQAGILIGDVLLELENLTTVDPSEVQEILAGRTSGQTIKAKLLRGGELKEIEITLGERPAGRRAGGGGEGRGWGWQRGGGYGGRRSRR